MSINRDTVNKVANLARLDLTEAETETMIKDLSNIVSFVEKINELDTTGITPTAHVLDVNNVMREDEEKPAECSLEDMISLAPAREGSFIAVPRVLE